MKNIILIDLLLVPMPSHFLIESLNYNIKLSSSFCSLHGLVMTMLFHIAHLILNLRIK